MQLPDRSEPVQWVLRVFVSVETGEDFEDLTGIPFNYIFYRIANSRYEMIDQRYGWGNA